MLGPEKNLGQAKSGGNNLRAWPTLRPLYGPAFSPALEKWAGDAIIVITLKYKLNKSH